MATTRCFGRIGGRRWRRSTRLTGDLGAAGGGQRRRDDRRGPCRRRLLEPAQRISRCAAWPTRRHTSARARSVGAARGMIASSCSSPRQLPTSRRRDRGLRLPPASPPTTRRVCSTAPKWTAVSPFFSGETVARATPSKRAAKWGPPSAAFTRCWPVSGAAGLCRSDQPLPTPRRTTTRRPGSRSHAGQARHEREAHHRPRADPLWTQETIIEPVFAQRTAIRGFGRFVCRGQRMCAAEWKLMNPRTTSSNSGGASPRLPAGSGRHKGPLQRHQPDRGPARQHPCNSLRHTRPVAIRGRQPRSSRRAPRLSTGMNLLTRLHPTWGGSFRGCSRCLFFGPRRWRGAADRRVHRLVVEAVWPHRTDGHGEAWRLLMANRTAPWGQGSPLRGVLRRGRLPADVRPAGRSRSRPRGGHRGPRGTDRLTDTDRRSRAGFARPRPCGRPPSTGLPLVPPLVLAGRAATRWTRGDRTRLSGTCCTVRDALGRSTTSSRAPSRSSSS
jgi:hypothetical protein